MGILVSLSRHTSLLLSAQSKKVTRVSQEAEGVANLSWIQSLQLPLSALGTFHFYHMPLPHVFHAYVNKQGLYALDTYSYFKHACNGCYKHCHEKAHPHKTIDRKDNDGVVLLESATVSVDLYATWYNISQHCFTKQCLTKAPYAKMALLLFLNIIQLIICFAQAFQANVQMQANAQSNRGKQNN